MVFIKYNKTKHTQNFNEGFTLIEVMVAVMIISVVVASLLKLFANNTHMIASLDKKLDASMYATLLVGDMNDFGSEFGFENDDFTMDDIVKEFRVEDSLRQKLKTIKVNVYYNILATLDAADMQAAIDDSDEVKDENGFAKDDAQGSNAASIEVGKTSLKLENGESSAFMRIRLLQ